jgi:DNA-binding TFAR19-related protein (PDSD5 family)
MASLFQKATQKTQTSGTTKSKRQTTWVVGDPAGDQVGKAVHELVVLTAQEKAIDAKKALFKTVVENYAERHFIEDYAELGVFPETPMQVVNSDGEKVSYVVQDRSSQYKVKPEQKDALVQLLGQDATEDLLYTEVGIKFNRLTMAKPGVAEAVEKALEAVIGKLVKAGKLAEEDELVEAEVKEAFKPGTLDRLGMICGKDTQRIKLFLAAMSSSATRYVKC